LQASCDSPLIILQCKSDHLILATKVKVGIAEAPTFLSFFLSFKAMQRIWMNFEWFSFLEKEKELTPA
jgi:hypothetical protein